MAKADKPLTISWTDYLGGLGDSPKKKSGNFMIVETRLGMSVLGKKFNPEIFFSEIEGVSFDSETLAKSRVGKALVFGVFALAAKSTKSVGQMTVHLKDGQIAAFEFEHLKSLELKAKVMGKLSPLGIPCLDDSPKASAPIQGSVIEQLQGAESLLKSGALTQNEFESLKSKILEIEETYSPLVTASFPEASEDKSGKGHYWGVVGTKYYLPALQAIIKGEGRSGTLDVKAVLVPEPENPHDSKAVKVVIGGETVGHIRSGTSGDVQDRILRSGKKIMKVNGRVTWDKDQDSEIEVGVEILNLYSK